MQINLLASEIRAYQLALQRVLRHSLVLLPQVGNSAEQNEGNAAEVAPGSVGEHRKRRVDENLT